MSSYITRTGDTFESIARTVYGDDAQAFALSAANPGVAGTIPAGLILVVPPDVTAPLPYTLQAINVGSSDVTIQIDGEVFHNWVNLRINRAFDSIDTFSFTAPFEPNNLQWREIFKPFSFKTVEVFVGLNKMFTGQMVTPMPISEPGVTTMSVSGYSLPGALQDCTPPAPNTGFQYEFNGLTVVEIAQALGLPFGIRAVGGNGSPGAVFKREGIEPIQKVLPFLAGLARQRKLVISSDENGSLVFHKEKSAPGTILEVGETSGKLVATFGAHESPIISVVPNFNAQQFYSHVTGFIPVVIIKREQNERIYTKQNNKLRNVLRPYNFVAKDTNAQDRQEAVEATMGRMYANAVEYSVEVSTWRNATSELWKPGDFIKLNWPEAMIYTDFTFFIRRVNFRKSANQETAHLTLTLPGGFAGKIPESLPWD